ncbi:hypothetical protein NQ314_008935 [Rhamnusium bicolor]|uniref:Uncharacterized protein n=1 Tax=Rhamnusium bicolor TaxID=1586634 RepID=A0AAV8Y725_9CUCU|nr:hypothetical protein NQ314_008935 [Rhamnusium bicolor]
MASQKLSTQELEDEVNKIMNSESDYASSSDEYIPSESEHYSSSESENAIILGDIGESSDDEVCETEPRTKRARTAVHPDSTFIWKFDEGFSPKIFDFDNAKSGVADNFPLEVDASESQYFKLFF